MQKAIHKPIYTPVRSYLVEDYGIVQGDEVRINYDGFTQVATRCREMFGPSLNCLFKVGAPAVSVRGAPLFASQWVAVYDVPEDMCVCVEGCCGPSSLYTFAHSLAVLCRPPRKAATATCHMPCAGLGLPDVPTGL